MTRTVLEKGVAIRDRLENFCCPFCPHSFLVPLASLIHWVTPSSPGGSCNNSLFTADRQVKLSMFDSIHHISFKYSVPITSRMSDVSHHKPQIATIPAPYVGQKWTWMWFRASNMCGKCPRHLLPSQARNIGGFARQMQLLFWPLRQTTCCSEQWTPQLA